MVYFIDKDGNKVRQNQEVKHEVLEDIVVSPSDDLENFEEPDKKKWIKWGLLVLIVLGIGFFMWKKSIFPFNKTEHQKIVEDLNVVEKPKSILNGIDSDSDLGF